MHGETPKLSDTLFWSIKEFEGKIASHYHANLEDRIMLSYFLVTVSLFYYQTRYLGAKMRI